MSHRRTFLQTVAATAAGMALAPSHRARAATTLPRAIQVRRNIYSLDPNGPEVAALRAGVKAMRALDPNAPPDPKSWGYQRAIHRTLGPLPSPVPTGWNTCTHHGSPGPAFLSWHRAYLYYFERICRAASGDPSFALPYWNYDLPGQNVLPWPFMNPPDATNSLWHGSRPMNNGDPLGPSALGAATTITIPAFPDFHAYLEDFHDNLHIGMAGSMASVGTAALDPIFYLHHANIDRCWRHWQRLHQSGNPVPLPSWWNTSWTFFDENGQQVQMTGQQAEHTDTLGYIYDDEPLSPRIVVALIPIRPRLINICERFPRLCEPRMPPQRPPWPLPLDRRRQVAVLPLTLPGPAVQALWETKKGTTESAGQGLLVLELILEWREGAPLIVVEARPVRTPGSGWIFGGSVSSFARGAAGQRDTIRIDVSRVLGALGRETSGRELEWRLRYSSGRVGPDGRERPVSDLRVPMDARIWGARLTIPESKRR